MEQRAGGDGLDRLAEAHFVGQQGAFGEGEVQHAFALVGKERRERLVRRPFAALDLLLVLVPQHPALCRALAGFQPRRDFLRNLHGGRACPLASRNRSSSSSGV